MLSEFIGDLGTSRGYLLVRRRVLSQIFIQANQLHQSKETGGILIGSYRGRHIDVTSCTIQQPMDLASKYGFHRRDCKHQYVATRNWRRSNGHLTYLGEWHSHPELDPSPSLVDTSSWVTATIKNKKNMIFIVVGQQAFWIGYSLYERGKCQIHRSQSLDKAEALDGV